MCIKHRHIFYQCVFILAVKSFDFISTHPDNDHVNGLERFSDSISTFYCVDNNVNKTDTNSLKEYIKLRDSGKCCNIEKGTVLNYFNSVIRILWPDVTNKKFKEALEKAEKTGSPNNISPIILLNHNNKKFLWLGDLETDFLESIYYNVDWPKEVDVVFAPHHGRSSAKIPKNILDELNPKLIVIGEAPSEYLDYYRGWNTITQNSAGDINFNVDNTGKIDIFVSNREYANKDLHSLGISEVVYRGDYFDRTYLYYLGTLKRYKGEISGRIF